MKQQYLKICFVMAAICLISGFSSATLVTPDLSTAIPGTDIKDNFEGITLTASRINYGPIHVRRSGVSGFLPDSESNLFFGNQFATHWDAYNNTFRVDFDEATTFVSLDIYGADKWEAANTARITAYDAAGQVLAVDDTINLAYAQKDTLSIACTEAEIAYVVMNPTLNDVRVNNLQYEAVPEPATLALLGMGGLLCIRLRKQK